MMLMAALVQQNKSLALILVKQEQKFVWVYITIIIIVTCLLTGKKSASLSLIIRVSNFQPIFVYEEYLMDLVLSNLEYI